jgi:glycosyltransferase involved in cell wall biosynthesis
VQATRLNSLYTLLMKLQAPISFGLEVENLKTAALVTAVSPPVQQALHRYPQCPPVVEVVWNGVDTRLFAPEPVRSGNDYYLFTAGRLGPGKGLEDLLDAFAMVAPYYPHLSLVIAGDGPVRDSLKQRAAAAGLVSRCRFVGHISERRQLAALYQHAALFVLPSHHEGLPTVLLEAMACGCPVLSTPVGGVPQVVQDGFNGWLTPANDPRRMAAALKMLLDDPARLDELGRQGRCTIEARFSWGEIGAAFAGRYAALAGKSRP